jgi:AmmeMemoRadiSam system protein A
MRSPETNQSQLEAADGERLVQIARDAIGHGLSTGEYLRVDTRGAAPALAAPAGSFVTLYRRETLRGCMGNLAADRPLMEAVARNAWQAAFADPRFPPLAPREFSRISLEVSVLSLPMPLAVESEAELLAALRPHEHGLILMAGSARSTFLPKVWESLPAPRDFVRELKRKAGLPGDYWSPSLRFATYSSSAWREAPAG